MGFYAVFISLFKLSMSVYDWPRLTFSCLYASGAHVAPLIGGPISEFLGWRWTFKTSAILNSAMLLIILFCLPETLYLREQPETGMTTSPSAGHGREYLSQGQDSLNKITWMRHIRRLAYRGRFGGRKLRPSDFVWPIVKLLKYASCCFSANESEIRARTDMANHSVAICSIPRTVLRYPGEEPYQIINVPWH